MDCGNTVGSPLLQRHHLSSVLHAVRTPSGSPVSSPVTRRFRPNGPNQLLSPTPSRKDRFLSPLPQRLRQLACKRSEEAKLSKTKPIPACIEVIEDFGVVDQHFSKIIEKAREGLKKFSPELCVEGVNGTYFLKSKHGKRIAVFKPQDEEGNSVNNPKKGSGEKSSSSMRTSSKRSLRKDFQVGEASYREVAAYLLDMKKRFYGVPNTCMVKITHPSWTCEKIGSFQEYIMNDGASWDISPSAFPVKEVHKIGILDLHIFNTDRHGGNILICDGDDGKYTLTPIDHGYSLPRNLERAWFDWLTWPQTKMPFDTDTKSYIENLDPEADAAMLQKYLPHIVPESLMTLKISTTLLKKGAQHNLNLFQIGDMASRRTEKEPSDLEVLCSEAMEQAKQSCYSSHTCDPEKCGTSPEQQVENHCGKNGENVDQEVLDKVFFQVLSKKIDQHMQQLEQKAINSQKQTKM